ncbi:sensor of ECF-type sigma factor [Flavobacteriaceae bacterium R38]|nr:sensor of ECF-type sigma factor [Flavobacteriaceae bacterium R38]
MKHYINNIFVLLMLFSSMQVISQDFKRERIKSLKIAYITEKLDLTATEAEKFWPIYNKYDDNTHQLRNVEFKKIRNQLRRENLNLISDQEALSILNQIENIESELYKEKKQLVTSLRKVISPKKIILLKKAEDDFNKELFRRLRDRRRQDSPRSSSNRKRN